MALARRIASSVAPQQVVAVLSPNSPGFRVAYQAALMARTIPALLNPLYPPPNSARSRVKPRSGR